MTDYRKQAAAALSAAFVTDKRADGTPFVHMADDAEDWMREAVREAHGDMLPDDVKYRMCEEVAGRLADLDSDEWDDVQGEECDGLVDVYNADRLRWLSSSLYRAAYINEARGEGLIGSNADEFERIGVGQYVEYREIWGVLQRACEEAGDELELDAEDDE
ncbi:hypothetical protein [uncultured Xanthomonas sp.]|uniref:hypothetical protein n=1 Tax=uncultured Xanthomonas sp. TaxID=152831 RepID=UPI0025F88211|nr:hypothetical protein [uncultured Xanthomonas sp.]